MRNVLPRSPESRRRWLVVLFIVTACVGIYLLTRRDPIVECTQIGNATPICGLRNPEDLALLSDGHTVIASQYGLGAEAAPGGLTLLDLDTKAITIAYPAPEGAASADSSAAQPGWGDAKCPGPPGRAFSPHGIDLSRRGDDKQQLIVVNHGGRESLEFFEVNRSGPSWSISWRGCILAPDDAFFNDVVGLADGSLLVTHMMSRSSPVWSTIRAKFGANTGYVYEWDAEHGFRVIPGTEAALPNGIEASPSGDAFFFNAYAGNEIRHHDRQSGKLLGRADVRGPDNVTWSKDGRLLVASQRGGFADMMECLQLSKGSCSMEFAIVAFNPKDWSSEVLYQNKGAPMGGATSAIDLGDGLLIGSFASDRVLRIRR